MPFGGCGKLSLTDVLPKSSSSLEVSGSSLGEPGGGGVDAASDVAREPGARPRPFVAIRPTRRFAAALAAAASGTSRRGTGAGAGAGSSTTGAGGGGAAGAGDGAGSMSAMTVARGKIRRRWLVCRVPRNQSSRDSVGGCARPYVPGSTPCRRRRARCARLETPL